MYICHGTMIFYEKAARITFIARDNAHVHTKCTAFFSKNIWQRNEVMSLFLSYSSHYYQFYFKYIYFLSNIKDHKRMEYKSIKWKSYDTTEYSIIHA